MGMKRIINESFFNRIEETFLKTFLNDSLTGSGLCQHPTPSPCVSAVC